MSVAPTQPLSAPLGWYQLAQGLAVAAALAFLFSLQYLAQPFVWREWPVDEVLGGWLFILRDRLLVAFAIALSVSMVKWVRTRSLRLRTALLAAAVLAGALSGESLVAWLYGIPSDIDSLTAHALRWSAAALAGTATFYLWRSSCDSREQWRRESLRRLNLQQQLTHTRLAALRSQIEPHFLFNTLATLRRLQRTQPEAGARMLGSLIEYLRRLARLPDRSVVPLGEEIDLLRAYLAVIEMRMSGRLRVRIDVPAALRHAQVPPLALATLVENAVKHGITRAPSGGEISIQARENAGQLELSVADTGAGLLPTAVSGPGIGLSNVRSSLATLYGALASLHVEANAPTGVRALLRLPYQTAAAR